MLLTDEREPSRHELEHDVHTQLAELMAALEHKDVENCELRRRVEELQRQVAAANASSSGNVFQSHSSAQLREHFDGENIGFKATGNVEQDIYARKPRDEHSLHHSDWSSLSISSSDTASDLPGPGRALGTLYTFWGKKLENWAGRVAHKMGYGPHATAERLEAILLREVGELCLNHEISFTRHMPKPFEAGVMVLVGHALYGTSITRIVAIGKIEQLFNTHDKQRASIRGELCMQASVHEDVFSFFLIKTMKIVDHAYFGNPSAARLCLRKVPKIMSVIYVVFSIVRLQAGHTFGELLPAMTARLHPNCQCYAEPVRGRSDDPSAFHLSRDQFVKLSMPRFVWIHSGSESSKTPEDWDECGSRHTTLVWDLIRCALESLPSDIDQRTRDQILTLFAKNCIRLLNEWIISLRAVDIECPLEQEREDHENCVPLSDVKFSCAAVARSKLTNTEPK